MRVVSILNVLLMLLGVGGATALQAQVLPEDRADVLYHHYDGGGVTIKGPSLLVRKQVRNDLSLSANYYVDSISSASIDVLSYASPYKEERTEVSVSADYLLGETILSTGFTHSDENDYNARTAWFGVQQEVFGGLTQISLSFARGWDEIGQITDPDFEREADRRVYGLSLSQVLSRNLVLNFEYEGVTNEGYLNNPYRQVRYRDGSDGYLWQAEVYPNTRTSSAFSVGGRYFLREGSVAYGNARLYTDTWGIDAWNAQLGYVYTWRNKWLLDVSYRYYTQTEADFYSDLFEFADAQNFLARDKEMSAFKDHTLRAEISYDFSVDRWAFLKRGTANFSYNYILFRYDNFRNVLAGGPAGAEPLYEFEAGITQLYLSFWF